MKILYPLLSSELETKLEAASDERNMIWDRYDTFLHTAMPLHFLSDHNNWWAFQLLI